MERVEGIEPSWPAWKAGTLPLCYTRKTKKNCSKRFSNSQSTEIPDSISAFLKTVCERLRHHDFACFQKSKNAMNTKKIMIPFLIMIISDSKYPRRVLDWLCLWKVSSLGL